MVPAGLPEAWLPRASSHLARRSEPAHCYRATSVSNRATAFSSTFIAGPNEKRT